MIRAGSESVGQWLRFIWNATNFGGICLNNVAQARRLYHVILIKDAGKVKVPAFQKYKFSSRYTNYNFLLLDIYMLILRIMLISF
jgi:hypothetical protein